MVSMEAVGLDREHGYKQAGAADVVLLRLSCPACGTKRFFKLNDLLFGPSAQHVRRQGNRLQFHSPCSECGDDKALDITLYAEWTS